jgi:hypothetical protein
MRGSGIRVFQEQIIAINVYIDRLVCPGINKE